MKQEDIMAIDLYELLECDPQATVSEIRRSFRKKSLECHPDKHPNNPEAAERFTLLNNAVEILTDESLRIVYDGRRMFQRSARPNSSHAYEGTSRGTRTSAGNHRPTYRSFSPEEIFNIFRDLPHGRFFWNSNWGYSTFHQQRGQRFDSTRDNVYTSHHHQQARAKKVIPIINPRTGRSIFE